MSPQLMRDFFGYLFHEKGLANSTIASFKSALSDPIRLSFDIDLQDRLFHLQRSSFFLTRPPTTPSFPLWSAHRVVAYILSPSFTATPVNSLRSTLFLLAMASGMRAKELASIRRSPSLLQFGTGDSSVTILPTPGSLRKNERPNFRFSGLTIPRLSRGDHASDLCPVLAIKRYITRTQESTSESLFLNITTGQPLHARGVAAHLVKLISAANPGVTVRAHETRKYSGSISWLRHRDESRVAEVGFWASTQTFFSHYQAFHLQEAPLVMMGSSPPVPPAVDRTRSPT